ncbi:hypothetical protein [Frondihabitans australicus]|uniref:Uncharacterized protein n=1 Tax=Frondihabitans australicus TaxID=386892 RepID=A0A495IBV8_9MICO|nr:hypothetical protein [Frondihabitans australicus]RKR73477.1 hypothetical protein C8E83_0570 [Frondihabitans australicus]
MDLDQLAVKVVTFAANRAMPGLGAPLEMILNDLLGVQDSQVVVLASIDSHVQALIDGPWKTGRRYLREAALPGRTADQAAAALVEAQAHFRSAVDLQTPSTFARASACLDLAMVCQLLGDSELATLYATECAREADAAVRPSRDRAARSGGLTSRVANMTSTDRSTAVTLMVFGAGGYLISKRAKRSLESKTDGGSEHRGPEFDQNEMLKRAAEALGAPPEPQPSLPAGT